MSEGAATTRGEVKKDIREAAVEQAGGIFIPLAVDTLVLSQSENI